MVGGLRPQHSFHDARVDDRHAARFGAASPHQRDAVRVGLPGQARTRQLRPRLGRGHGRTLPDGAADAASFLNSDDPADALTHDAEALGVARAHVRDGGADAEAHIK